MSTYRSSRVYRTRTPTQPPAQQPPPPEEPPAPKKKSKTGLIVGIIIGVVVLIIIIIIIILLTRRSSSSTPTTTTCKSNSDCSGSTSVCNTSTGKCVGCLNDTNCGSIFPKCDTTTNKCVGCLDNSSCSGATPVCDTTAKVCVGCLTNTNCVSPQICNTTSKTCVDPQCLTNANCLSTPATPKCTAGNVCAQCNVSLDCANNSIYSSQGKNICDITNNSCVGCLTAADCGGAPNTCNNGTCCILTAPVVTFVTSEATSDSVIGVVYTSAINLTNRHLIYELSDPVSGMAFYTSGQIPTGSTINSGQIIIKQSDTQKYFFPGYAYQVKVKIVAACGTTAYSNGLSTTIPPQTVAGTASVFGELNPNQVVCQLTNVAQGQFMVNSSPAILVVSRTSGIHPNLAEMITGNVPQSSRVCTPQDPPNTAATCTQATWISPWTGNGTGNDPAPLLGETWYLRAFLASGWTNVNGGAMSNSSAEQSFAIII